jgi:hypothetical protein
MVKMVRAVNLRSPQDCITWGEDRTIIDAGDLEEAIVRCERGDLDEALIMLVRAIPRLSNLEKLRRR